MAATSDDLKASCTFFYLSILGTSSSTCSVVYTSQIGYLREQQNRWTMKFFVIKNINTIIKVFHYTSDIVELYCIVLMF